MHWQIIITPTLAHLVQNNYQISYFLHRNVVAYSLIIIFSSFIIHYSRNNYYPFENYVRVVKFILDFFF